MRNSFTWLTLYMLMFVFFGHAQVTTYDIARYQLPEVNWQMLETSFHMSGVNRTLNHSAEENFTKSLDGAFKIDYNHFQNTETWQRHNRVRVQSSFSRSETNRADVLFNKERILEPMISVNSENRRYFRNNLFLEINLDAGYLYSSRAQRELIFEKTRKSKIFSATVPIKIGIGRIEQIQDARHAIYIFDELARAGRSGNRKNDQEVEELAKHISTLKNERFFDSRIRLMEEIESVDSFLVAHNHVTHQDARYFTTLTDFWMHGNVPVRYSGNRASIAVLPGYRVDNVVISRGEPNYPDQKRELHYIGIGPEFIHEKPLNLHWQNSISVRSYLKLYKEELRETMTEFSHALGFYPGTRTWMSWQNTIGYNTRKLSQELVSNQNTILFNSSVNMHYYISSQFRLSGNSHLFLDNNKTELNRSFLEEEFHYISNGKHRSASFYWSVNLIYQFF